MKRDNLLFRPVCAGALGLTPLFFRKIVLRYFFLFFRNSTRPIFISLLKVNSVTSRFNLFVSLSFLSEVLFMGVHVLRRFFAVACEPEVLNIRLLPSSYV